MILVFEFEVGHIVGHLARRVSYYEDILVEFVIGDGSYMLTLGRIGLELPDHVLILRLPEAGLVLDSPENSIQQANRAVIRGGLDVVDLTLKAIFSQDRQLVVENTTVVQVQ